MNRTFALLLSKNEQFTRTTKEQIPNPASFPLGPFSLSHNTTTRPHPKQTVAHFSTPLTTNSLHDVLHLSCLQTTLLAQHSSTLLSKYLKNLIVNAYSGGKTVQTILMYFLFLYFSRREMKNCFSEILIALNICDRWETLILYVLHVDLIFELISFFIARLKNKCPLICYSAT